MVMGSIPISAFCFVFNVKVEGVFPSLAFRVSVRVVMSCHIYITSYRGKSHTK